MTLKIPTSSFLVIIIYMYVLWLIVIILHILSYIRLLQSYYRHCFYNYQSPSRHLMTLLCSLQVHQSSGTIPFSGNIPTVWVKSPFNIVFFFKLAIFPLYFPFPHTCRTYMYAHDHIYGHIELNTLSVFSGLSTLVHCISCNANG